MAADPAPVAVLGAGNMGVAVARRLLSSQHRVTVWNRTPGRTGPLVDLGATAVDDLADAVASAPVVVVTVSDYPAATTVLGTPPSGPTVVNLCTGTPAEARRFADAVRRAGAVLLDGYPTHHADRVGTADALTVYAGPRRAYEEHREVLDSLGRHAWLGEDPGLAKAAAIASAPAYHGVMVALAAGAAYAEAEGMDVADYVEVMRPFVGTVKGIWDSTLDHLAAGTWVPPRTTIDKQVRTSRRTIDAFAAAGLPPSVLGSVAEVFAAAAAMGHGSDDTAAVVEVLRSRGGTPRDRPLHDLSADAMPTPEPRETDQ
ncbi:3-hydroxyisobutyrate dehydrogenase-like beta-hydroxyacid dehydrogenase [Nocardioides thalensis]|uniref:3-hydroxyisobutyrate dehydrogenase-like beta-hydroxyacid dehydrogenase n=1 Tax=Nocardioides thalensis TaxID=1914755 RepID=A0A853CAW8_9ACTN|nr:NAD(P)-binding domain-containing protein [Nocardioides thalensis]NYJ03353.1 3-hydroxyisobutyrate dehydrogenase-like beta-hydroxyacid dehydrogenase [Nocardioides thalensis]